MSLFRFYMNREVIGVPLDRNELAARRTVMDGVVRNIPRFGRYREDQLSNVNPDLGRYETGLACDTLGLSTLWHQVMVNLTRSEDFKETDQVARLMYACQPAGVFIKGRKFTCKRRICPWCFHRNVIRFIEFLQGRPAPYVATLRVPVENRYDSIDEYRGALSREATWIRKNIWSRDVGVFKHIQTPGAGLWRFGLLVGACVHAIDDLPTLDRKGNPLPWEVAEWSDANVRSVTMKKCAYPWRLLVAPDINRDLIASINEASIGLRDSYPRRVKDRRPSMRDIVIPEHLVSDEAFQRIGARNEYRQ